MTSQVFYPIIGMHHEGSLYEGYDMFITETEKGEFLDTDQLARILGLSPGTLRTWRWSGVGPKFHRLNGIAGPVRYRRDDIELWLNGNAVDPSKKVKKENA